MNVDRCRLCRSRNLQKFLDLGSHPPSDAFLTERQLEAGEEPCFPLGVYSCGDCGQAQLGYAVSSERLFCRNYPYESSTTKTGRNHFFEMAETIHRRFKLSPESLVVDLGSNVGVLLDGFWRQGTRVLGVDPASDMAKIANDNGIETIAEFFTEKLAVEMRKKYGRASAITATNVFAHIHDLDDAVEGVKALLNDEGVFVVESPHFKELVERVEYDTIYHEHLSYQAAKPLAQFFKKHDLELIDVQKRPIHGGTIRYFVARRGVFPVAPAVHELIAEEMGAGIYQLDRLKKFARDVEGQQRQLLEMLKEIRGRGERVVGVSAPAKGNTLLNYCGIGSDLLEYITERAQIKVGLYTPGTHIPIYSDEKLFKDQPEYALILAWNFAEEIMRNLEEYKKRGGKFIIPIPTPKIVT